MSSFIIGIVGLITLSYINPFLGIVFFAALASIPAESKE